MKNGYQFNFKRAYVSITVHFAIYYIGQAIFRFDFIHPDKFNMTLNITKKGQIEGKIHTDLCKP